MLKERSEETLTPLEMSAARQEREKVNSLRTFGSHGNRDSEDTDSNDPLAWFKGLDDDAVFLEARALLGDIILAYSSPAKEAYSKTASGF